jgi:hypothetical protein
MGRFKTLEERQAKVMAKKQAKKNHINMMNELRRAPKVDFTKPQTDVKTEAKD